MTETNDLAEWLTDVLGDAFGAPVEVAGVTRLSAGASRETWAVDALVAGDRRALVLQRGGVPDTDLATDVAVQARAMGAARAHGVPVPEVVASGRDRNTEWLVTAHVAGESLPRRILAGSELAGARRGLARECGRVLARIHAVPPGDVDGIPERDALATLRAIVDDLGEARPAWELAFRWLAGNRPPARPATLVHGDLRTGNLLVDAEGLRAVVDWELVHVGDPREDLGWLCVRTWRFGGPGRVGGFGSLDELLGGYADEGGAEIDAGEVGWWEVLGNLRWAVICLLQARRHASGREPSVELAAVGRRAYEAEYDLLELVAGGA